MNDMRKSRLRRLLELYFDGETDLRQERLLRGYFAEGKEVDPEFEKYRALFGFCLREAGGSGMADEAEMSQKRAGSKERVRKVIWTVSASMAAAAAVLSAVVLLMEGTGVDGVAVPGIEYTIDGVPVNDDALALETLHSELSRIGTVSEAVRRNSDKVSAMLCKAGDALDDMDRKLKIK